MPSLRGVVSETMTVEDTFSKELTTGSTFAGRYQVIEELAKGGMGRVYKVFDSKINERVALKIINPEIAADNRTIERFKNELKLARKISHRNVCRMYDLGEEGGISFITMEFVQGEDLKGSITRMGPLSPARAISITRQVCKGLAEAHAHGVVHRDLKPQNIMIDSKGNARIMDFGIARSLRKEGITKTGMVIGTPEYMSPEQIDGKDVDYRTDIYTLGVILYEMVTGKVPFEGDTPLSVALKHKSEIPRDPRELNDQLPEGLSRVIMKCMEKEKEKRYQSLKELIFELDRTKDDMPTVERELLKKELKKENKITLTLSIRKLFIPTLIVLVAVVIASAVVFMKTGLDVESNRVAVAIFDNKTGSEELDMYGLLASDWVSCSLSQTDVFNAVPVMTVLESSLALRTKVKDLQSMRHIRRLARATEAGTVLSGSYYLVDDILRFETKIMDAKQRRILHALEPVNGPSDSPMEVIEMLRQRILATLGMYFEPLPSRLLRGHQPPLIEAYQEYMVGLEYLGKSFSQAMRHFEKSIELDPEFMAPLTPMAIIYACRGGFAQVNALMQTISRNGGHLTPFEQSSLDWYEARLEGNYPKVLQFLQEAKKSAPSEIAIDLLIGIEALRNNNPRKTIGTYEKMELPEDIYSYESGELKFEILAEANHLLENFQRELELAREGQNLYPDRLGLHIVEIRAVAALGRTQEIQKVIDRSLTMPPQEVTPADVMLEAALELRAHGYMDEAERVADMAVNWYQDRLSEKASQKQRAQLAFTLYVTNQWEKAENVYEGLAEENPDCVEYKGFLGRLAARMKKREEALKISEELQKVNYSFLFGYHTYCRACIESLLGEFEQAVELLKEAFAQGHAYGVYLHREMDLEPLRNYPPFQELVWPKD